MLLVFIIKWVSNIRSNIKNTKHRLYEKENDLLKQRADVEKMQKILLEKERVLTGKEQGLSYKIIQTNESIERSLEMLKNEENNAAERKAKINKSIEKIINDKTKSFPWVAKLISDYIDVLDERLANYLEMKIHPAKRSADLIREIKNEKRKLEYDFRTVRYTLDYYESLFPNLKEYSEDGLDELSNSFFKNNPIQDENEGEYEPAINLLSEEEQLLSHTDRLQRALDNYFDYNRSRWEKGKKYERYVGYYYEKKGYSVNYHGIEKRLEDLGIDLICTKPDETLLIQCKYWNQWLIREASINQLFGTSVKYAIEHYCKNQQIPFMFSDLLSNYNIVPMIITSSQLSDTAINFAQVLGIKVKDKFPFERYPIIKCNINRQTGDKIYHLPFDQQYDNTVIEYDRGEFYATTIAEAEQKDFRRAYRWRGN